MNEITQAVDLIDFWWPIRPEVVQFHPSLSRDQRPPAKVVYINFMYIPVKINPYK